VGTADFRHLAVVELCGSEWDFANVWRPDAAVYSLLCDCVVPDRVRGAERKRLYNPALTLDDPWLQTLLEPKVTVSTMATTVGLRELGGQMIGPQLERIILLTAQGPIHGRGIESVALPPQVIADVKVQYVAYTETFNIPRLPAGNFDVVFISGDSEHRVHVYQNQLSWLR
jgi:hypothetical protein